MRFQIAVLLALASGVAPAATVGFNFSGPVTQIILNAPPEPGFGGLGVGDLVKGSVIFDLNSPDLDPNPAGEYATISHTVLLGPVEYTAAAGFQKISIFTPAEYAYVVTATDASQPFVWQNVLQLFDFTSPYVFTDTLLRLPPPIGELQNPTGTFELGGPFNLLFYDVTELTPCDAGGGGIGPAPLPACIQASSVPEPVSFLPIAAGLLAFVLRRRNTTAVPHELRRIRVSRKTAC